MEGLHIDSYKKIKSIDGYQINCKKINQNNFHKELKNEKKLWFVNLGGYKRDSMQEQHEFGLVVAKNSLEAKKMAKSKWLLGYKKTHKDNISKLETISDVDDCEKIQYIDNWEIELILDDNFNEEIYSPDWYGYMRIDQKL
jgi:hypothetical protein